MSDFAKELSICEADYRRKYRLSTATMWICIILIYSIILRKIFEEMNIGSFSTYVQAASILVLPSAWIARQLFLSRARRAIVIAVSGAYESSSIPDLFRLFARYYGHSVDEQRLMCEIVRALIRVKSCEVLSYPCTMDQEYRTRISESLSLFDRQKIEALLDLMERETCEMAFSLFCFMASSEVSNSRLIVESFISGDIHLRNACEIRKAAALALASDEPPLESAS